MSIVEGTKAHRPGHKTFDRIIVVLVMVMVLHRLGFGMRSNVLLSLNGQEASRPILGIFGGFLKEDVSPSLIG